MPTEFIRITESGAEELSPFAEAIVREHFDPIIGTQQNTYMIRRFQFPEAIREQMEQGYRYYYAVRDGEKAGFLAIYPRDGKMYLSKFYVHSSFRGKHIATDMFRFVKEQTEKEGLGSIFLNVNRFNDDVIAVYRHLGFRVVREEKNDIGNGWYMDDLVMEYELNGNS